MRMSRPSDAATVPPCDELLVGAAEIASFLRTNPRLVRRLIPDEGLPVARIGIFQTTTRSAVTAWLGKRLGGNDG
jgi:hypothetical protein